MMYIGKNREGVCAVKCRIWCLVMLLMLLCGCGTSAENMEAPSVTPAPSVLLGDWVPETGGGETVWQFREDGTVLVPQTALDAYRTMGGLGTWQHTEGTDTLTVTLHEEIPLTVLTEDGFTKLHCPAINGTLVRSQERQAAYDAKFVDVRLSDENVWEYFSLRQQEAPVDESGERIWKEVFVMCSPMYDRDLLYWSEQNVELDFVYWTTYQLQADRAPYGVSFLVDDFNSVTAKGTVTYVRRDHVAEYHCDGDSRRVVLNDGTVWQQDFEDYRYHGYPY